MTDVKTLPSREDVEKALEAVHDPHVPVSLRRMGMLREIEIGEDGTVTVQVCIPCMGCPGVGMLRENVREAVLAVPGVTQVNVARSEEHTLNSSHTVISYAVFCLKKKKNIKIKVIAHH